MTVDRWHQEKGARAHGDIWNSWDSPPRFASRCKSPLQTSVSSHNLWMFISAKLTTWTRIPIFPFRRKKLRHTCHSHFSERHDIMVLLLEITVGLQKRFVSYCWGCSQENPLFFSFHYKKETKGVFQSHFGDRSFSQRYNPFWFSYPSRCTHATCVFMPHDPF